MMEMVMNKSKIQKPSNVKIKRLSIVSDVKSDKNKYWYILGSKVELIESREMTTLWKENLKLDDYFWTKIYNKNWQKPK